MKFIIPCFYLLFLFLNGCDTRPNEKLLAPATSKITFPTKADGDGIIVRGGKLVPMVGPLLPGQVRPMVRVPDEVQKGDPDGTGNEARRIGDPTAED